MTVEVQKLLDLIKDEGVMIVACGDGGDGEANESLVNDKAAEMLRNGEHLLVIKDSDDMSGFRKVAEVVNGKVVLEPDFELKDIIDWNNIMLALPETIGIELYKEATVDDVDLDEFYVITFDSNEEIDFYSEEDPYEDDED